MPQPEHSPSDEDLFDVPPVLTSVDNDNENPEFNTGHSTIERVNNRLRAIQNRVSKILGSITIEPMLFFHMVAWSSLGVNVQNYYLQRICEREYGGNPSIDCTNLTANKTAEAHVESIATVYSTFRSLIEAGLPLIFSLFIGPWSDKHGSKPIMILPLFGYTASSILLYLFSLAKDIDPGLLLIASIPVALTGGVIAFLVSAFRYVASASTTTNRSFRMAVAEGSWFVGSPLGLLGSAALFKIYGYPVVFLGSIILFAMSTLYAIFFVKSDKPESDEEYRPLTSICADMFNIEAVKDTFRTTFGKRNGSQRLWIVLLLIVTYLRVFTIYGSSAVTYLYTRQMFSWDAAAYSAYVTYDGIIGIVGSTTVAVLGMRIYKISDSKIGLFSSCSYLAGGLVWLISGFTTFSWMMYLGATVQMFCGLITIMTRSMLSKIVHKDEVGKVYSILASGEAAVPIFASPLYNYIYGKSVDSFPATPYVLNSSLNIIILVTFIYFCCTTWNATIIHQALEEEGSIQNNEEQVNHESDESES